MKETQYKFLPVSKKTHAKLKIQAVKAGMSFDEYINHLMTNQKK